MNHTPPTLLSVGPFLFSPWLAGTLFAGPGVQDTARVCVLDQASAEGECALGVFKLFWGIDARGERGGSAYTALTV